MNGARWLGVGLCVAGAFACRTAAPVPDFGAKGLVTDPAVVVDELKARAARVRSISGEGKLSVETGQGSGKVTAMVAVVAPDRIRIDAVSPFGPLTTIASDGSSQRWIDHERRLYDTAPVGRTPGWMPVPVCPDELVWLLSGSPPLLEDAAATLSFDVKRALYVLSLDQHGKVEQIVLETATLRPVELVMPERVGCGGYFASLADYDADDDLPRTVKVSSSTGHGSVQLRWRDRALNVPIEEETFRPVPPDGYAPVSTPRPAD